MKKNNKNVQSKGKKAKKALAAKNTPAKKPAAKGKQPKKPKIAAYVPTPATTPKKPPLIKAHGRTQTNLWKNKPKSDWLPVEDHDKWRKRLPNAYVYRARVVDPNGNPIPIKRDRGEDPTGLLYVGETGVKESDPSYRGEKLAAGLADRAVGTKNGAHGGARKYWAEGWDTKLPPGHKVQFGWDEQTEFTMPAAKDVSLPEDQQTDEMITNSGKGFAMGEEDKFLRPYTQVHKEWPPLNSADSPGFRNRDRKSQNELDQDRKDRSEGDVDGV